MGLPRRFAPRNNKTRLLRFARNDILEKVVFWGLCATLVFVPLPVGLTEEWGIFAFEVVTLFLFSLYFVRRCFTKEVDGGSKEYRRSKFPFLFNTLLIIFFIIVVIQLIPLPQFLLKVLSPQTSEVYSEVYSSRLNELGGFGWKTLSFSQALSIYEVIKYICYFLFAYLVLKCVKTKREIEILVIVMLVCAVFQSFYGLLEYFGGTERILGYKKEWGLGSATGTYINRNHFAGFLEMVFPISLGYLLVKADFFAMKKGMSLKEKILWFSQERLQKSIVLGFISVIVGIGMFFSRSRSGIFIFLITVFLMIIVLSLEEMKNSVVLPKRKRFGRIIKAVFLLTLFSVVMLGIKPIIERFTWEKVTRQNRTTYFKNTVDLVKSYPLFGTGSGTFIYMYPMFDKVRAYGIVEHAHNDYVEFIAESGLIGGGCLILLAFVGVGYVFVKWRKRRDSFVKGVGLGCILAIIAILIHSMSDFNLQIPANAVYFVVLYSLALNTVNLRRNNWL